MHLMWWKRFSWLAIRGKKETWVIYTITWFFVAQPLMEYYLSSRQMEWRLKPEYFMKLCGRYPCTTLLCWYSAGQGCLQKRYRSYFCVEYSVAFVGWGPQRICFGDFRMSTYWSQQHSEGGGGSPGRWLQCSTESIEDPSGQRGTPEMGDWVEKWKKNRRCHMVGDLIDYESKISPGSPCPF